MDDPLDHVDKVMDEMVENAKRAFTTLSSTTLPTFHPHNLVFKIIINFIKKRFLVTGRGHF